MEVREVIINCGYDTTTFTRAPATNPTIPEIRKGNNRDGYLVASVSASVANSTSTPVPKVKLTAAGEQIYGAIATVNTSSETTGIITGGIVPLKVVSGTTPAAANIGFGVIGAAGGFVDAAAAGAGRGTIVGYTGQIFWVDLDVNANDLT